MTHADLVQAAGRWLRYTKRCGVVLLEHHGGTVEYPDAIGFRRWYSIQVECKVSVADFRRDARKAGRRDEYRQAVERWYLTPVGLVTSMPDDWGLLEYDGRRVRVARAVPVSEIPVKAEGTWRAEVTRLYCELRRYQAQGIKYRTVVELMADEKAERDRRRLAVAAGSPEPKEP
jgi:hypothetical protein